MEKDKKCPATDVKYKVQVLNARFISPNDLSYQLYRLAQIKRQREKVKVVSVENIVENNNALVKGARSIEKLLQEWLQSDNKRILEYDVVYKGERCTYYRELDAIWFGYDGSITLFEIKATSNANSSQAIAQLSSIYEVLSSLNMTNIHMVAINVDMAESNSRDDFNKNCIKAFRNVRKFNDILYYDIMLKPQSILELAKNSDIHFDTKLFSEAVCEAKTIYQTKREKGYAKLERKFGVVNQRFN